MLNAFVRFRVALLALAVMLLPALAFATTTDAPANHHSALVFALGLSAAFLIGTVVVTYNFTPQGTTTPVSSTVAPTATQALGFNAIGVLVSMADADTTATLTHNWGLSTNQANQYQPWISQYQTVSGTAVPQAVFSVSNTNAAVLTKAAGTGTGGSWVVILQRPNTIVQ